MTSIDYAEVAGLNISLSYLESRKNKSNEEAIVAEWLRQRIIELKSKK